MKLHSHSALYYSIFLLFSFVTFAQEECVEDLTKPIFVAKEFIPEISRDEISVKADKSELINDELAIFEGNIQLQRERFTVFSEFAELNRKARSIVAKDKIRLATDSLTVTAEELTASMDAQTMALNDSEYQLSSGSGKGQARLLQINREGGFLMQGASFSTCMGEQQDWKIVADSIEISPDNAWGQTKNTKFYLFDVPVLWLPYFGFPLTDQRQTGLLYPKIASSSKHGLEIEQPVYWNMAQNYDATISPRLMTNRGLQLKTEFRYLTNKHQGQIDLEYLSSDDAFSDKSSRQYKRLQHLSLFDPSWRMMADLAHVSDENYINDLGSEHHQKTDTNLSQTVSFSYLSKNLNGKLAFEDFQVLASNVQGYKVLPEITLEYRDDIGWNLAEYSLNTQLSQFQNLTDSNIQATRLHLEPSVYLPYSTPSGNFELEAKLFHTQYFQDNNAGIAIDERVTRTIPQYRVSANLNFERELMLSESEYIQTLEPKVQYLYTGYEDQSKIGLYDTSLLLEDFYGLFRTRRFSGLDRIADANQVSIGVTSRLFDKQNRERMQVSVGQIFYLEDSRTGLGDDSSQIDKGDSALAAELTLSFRKHWAFRGDFQYDADNSQTRASSVAIDYRHANNKFVQLNHRFSRDISDENIEQIGFLASWPLTKNWQFIASLYNDLQGKRTTESILGLQYESCCWAIQIAAHRHINSQFGDIDATQRDDFDSGVSLRFVLKGNKRTAKIENIFDQGIFAYRKPYILND